MTTITEPFLDRAYEERCRALSKVLLDFLPMGRIHSVVDLGCGSGLIGKEFEKVGCHVIYIDGREENLAPLEAEGRETICADVHYPYVALNVDLVLCLGVLYHSEEPLELLRNCHRMSPTVALETLCYDLSGVYCLLYKEPVKRTDQSMTGGGSIATPEWLRRGLTAVGYDEVQDLSSLVPTIERTNQGSGYMYNWRVSGTGDSYRGDYALRKLLIAREKETF